MDDEYRNKVLEKYAKLARAELDGLDAPQVSSDSVESVSAKLDQMYKYPSKFKEKIKEAEARQAELLAADEKNGVDAVSRARGAKRQAQEQEAGRYEYLFEKSKSVFKNGTAKQRQEIRADLAEAFAAIDNAEENEDA